MRESALIARQVLDYACNIAEAGMTTDDVDKLAHEEMIRLGVFPSPINYRGFPKSICTSVNEIACHGIPTEDVTLSNGDVLSIDVSLFHKGYHGDNCKTVIVGEKFLPQTDTLRKHQKLIESNIRGLEKAIEACGPGRCITDIGAAIQVATLHPQ
jgi:methionyl aminopeptidase